MIEKPPIALFIFSNDLDKINTEPEQANIKNAFREKDDNNFIRCEIEVKVTTDRLFELFGNYKGRIVMFHFAGHADGTGILLDDNHANIQGLSDLFKQEVENGQLQFVFLNGCSTSGQAELLKKAGIPHLITTNCPINDLKAIAFSERFYKSFTNTKGETTLKQAFENGKARLKTDYPTIEDTTRGFVLEGQKEQFEWELYSNNENWVLPNIDYSTKKIVDKFRQKSSLLRDVKCSFRGNHKIKKSEVGETLNWIKSEDKKNRICIINGVAGIGKTSILRELLVDLERGGIPVLGIKVDKFLKVESLQRLQDELELSKSLSETFNKLSSSNSKVVLVLDQLDALSFASSGNRTTLRMYYNLISELRDIKGLHIVFSARTFDIENDPLLKDCVRLAKSPDDKSKNEQPKKIEIQKLKLQEVKEIFIQENLLDFDTVPKLVQGLLLTPLHLEVFLEIYDINLDLEKLTSLERLYDKLWEDKIEQDSEEDIFYKIANKMTETKKLTCPIRLWSKSDIVVVERLVSKGFLTKTSNQVQFFHQTFFDYVFARSFIQSEQSLIQYIFDNHQGLFIRPHIKSILDFLRGEDEVSYQNQLEAILSDDKIRFHIKLLITNMIAFQTNPTRKEQEIILKYIMSDKNLKGIFLEQVNIVGWWSFLVKHRIVDKLVEYYDDGEKQYGNRHLSHRFLVKSGRLIPNEILKYFHREISPKDILIVQAVLHGLEDWTNPLSVSLYDKFEGQFDDFQKCFSWEKALNTQPNWVLEKLKLAIEKGDLKSRPDNNIYYYYKNIFEKIFTKYPKKGLSFGLEVIKKGIEENQNQHTNGRYLGDSSLGFDYSFMKKSSRSDDYLQNLMDLVYKTLIDISENDRNYVLKIIEDLFKTDYLTLHCLGLAIFLKSNTDYRQEVFDWFVQYGNEVESNNDDRISYYWQLLIGKYIKRLSEEQQKIVKEFILNFSPIFAKTDYTHNKYGELQFKYLSTFSEDFIDKDYQLKKRFQELKRRFGKKVEPKEPIATFYMWGSESPIPQEKLKRIDKSSLKKVLTVHENSKEKEFGKPLLHDIGDDFYKIVKENPQEYAQLIEELIDEKKCSEYRIIKGLKGLHDGHYDVHKFKKIFKKVVHRIPVSTELIWSIDYFRDTKTVDNDILDFLEKCIDNHNLSRENTVNTHYNGIPNTKQKANDLLTNGINTTVGAACYTIMKMNQQEELTEHIFQIFNKAAAIEDDRIKATILAPLGQLRHLDKEKVLSLFLELIQTNNEELLYLSCSPALQILHINFEKIIPYLRRISNIESTQTTAGQALMAGWLSDYANSEILLKEALSINDKIIEGAVKVGFDWTGGKHTEKALEIINQFAGERSEEVSFVYEWAFDKFEIQDFEQWKPMMEKFVTVPRKDMNYCYQYLLKCVKDYPSDCIDLLKYFDIHSVREHSLNNTKALDLLIEAYNNLDKIDFNQGEKAMDIFDKMICHSTYRESATSKMREGDLR
jgi:hypothetical protein